jgi:REP element-mobilizing transposase RayT
MSRTYTQLYVQYVFTVKGRKNFLLTENNKILHKYIKGIVEKRKSTLLAINNTTDHMHILASVNPNYSFSKFIQEIKAGSSKYINDQKWVTGKFQWQSVMVLFPTQNHILRMLLIISMISSAII